MPTTWWRSSVLMIPTRRHTPVRPVPTEHWLISTWPVCLSTRPQVSAAWMLRLRKARWLDSPCLSWRRRQLPRSLRIILVLHSIPCIVSSWTTWSWRNQRWRALNVPTRHSQMRAWFMDWRLVCGWRWLPVLRRIQKTWLPRSLMRKMLMATLSWVWPPLVSAMPRLQNMHRRRWRSMAMLRWAATSGTMRRRALILLQVPGCGLLLCRTRICWPTIGIHGCAGWVPRLLISHGVVWAHIAASTSLSMRRCLMPTGARLHG